MRIIFYTFVLGASWPRPTQLWLAYHLAKACRLSVSGLGSASAARQTSSTAVLSAEVTAATVASRPVSIKSASSTTVLHVGSSSVVVASSIGTGFRASRLDYDVLAVDHMRVGGNGGLVSGGRLELNKGTVLKTKPC
jgi:hypothetical protein